MSDTREPSLQHLSGCVHLLFKIVLILLLSLVSMFLSSFLFPPDDREEELDELAPQEDDEPEQHKDKALVDGFEKKEPVYLPPEEPTDLPIIVWWTDFVPHEREVKQCKEGSWLITKSRTELINPNTHVSVFMYYGTDIDWDDLPLPRKPHHMWALLHEESLRTTGS